MIIMNNCELLSSLVLAMHSLNHFGQRGDNKLSQHVQRYMKCIPVCMVWIFLNKINSKAYFNDVFVSNNKKRALLV